MGRSMKKQREIAAQEKLEKEKALIEAAMLEGRSTVSEISKCTDMTTWHIYEVLNKDQALYAKYTVRRKAVANMAADNIASIVADKDHPNNYAASKFVVTKYRSDFENILEPQDKQEISVEIPSTGESENPVKIVFTKS